MAELVKTQKAPQQEKAAHQKQSEKRGKPAANPQQMMDAPDTLRSGEVLSAQQRVGNQAIQRALDDNSRRKGVENVADTSGNLRDDISNSIQSERGSGSPLPKEIQTQATRTLQHNFDNVRIHTDAKADSLSRSIQARAFTIGSDIFFKGGVFSPNSKPGRETLIHELTHVVQQAGTHSSGRLKLGPVGNAMEREADHMGKKAASTVQGKSAGSVQRWGEEEEVQTQPEASSVQRSPEEEEEIQMQPEAASVQRCGEEEEIQTQPEAASIQRAPEEEEIQTQPEAGSVQRSPEEEEEIQTQPEAASVQRDPEEEEEVQTQPEAGTVQRLPSFEDIKKKMGGLFSRGQAPTPGVPVTPAHAGPNSGPHGVDFKTELQAKANKLVPSNTAFGRFKSKFKSPTDPRKDPSDTFNAQQANDPRLRKNRSKLLHTLSNPTASTDEVEKAAEDLKTLFPDKTTQKIAEDSMKNRKFKLMERAKRGDQKALASYRSENTMMGKLKRTVGKAKGFYNDNKEAFGFIKEHGPSLLGMLGLKGNGGGGGGGGNSQVVNINGGAPGAGGGGGGGGMMEIMNEYARLKNENEALKKQLAEKQPAT
jgi:hypothetical protein